MKELEEIFKRLGGPTQVALDLKCHQFTIERWRKQGIPQKHWDFLLRKLKDISVADLYTINKRIKSR